MVNSKANNTVMQTKAFKIYLLKYFLVWFSYIAFLIYISDKVVYLGMNYIGLPATIFVIALCCALYIFISIMTAKKEWQKINHEFNRGYIQ